MSALVGYGSSSGEEEEEEENDENGNNDHYEIQPEKPAKVHCYYSPS